MTITIPPGQTSAQFHLTPGGASGARQISITSLPPLNYAGSPFTFTATQPLPTTITLALAGNAPLGTPVLVTITIDQPAPAGGITVTPASDNPSDSFGA